MKRRYWAVCYGHVCRWAGPCATASEAVHEVFGVWPTIRDAVRITVRLFPSNPRYMPLKQRIPWLKALYASHKGKTGIEIK